MVPAYQSSHQSNWSLLMLQITEPVSSGNVGKLLAKEGSAFPVLKGQCHHKCVPFRLSDIQTRPKLEDGNWFKIVLCLVGTI
jgi:hypothetical protein